MKLDERLRRKLIGAWDESETLEEALVAIQAVVDEVNSANAAIEEREWGSYDLNPYYNPEKCGLEILGVAEQAEAYEFDYIVLWKDIKSGRLFMGQDAGCSCPTPFEGVRGVGDLTEVTTFADMMCFVGSASAYSSYTDSSMGALVRACRKAAG